MGCGILQSGLKCGKNTSSGVNLKWLEIRCTGNGTVGSNPTHSARNHASSRFFRLLAFLFSVRCKAQTIEHCVSRSQLRAVIQMCINVRRSWEIAVTKPFLNLLHRHTVCQKERSTAMPEIVIPDLSHSLCLEQFRKTLCGVVGLDQIANLIDTYILKITLFFAGSCMSNTSSI